LTVRDLSVEDLAAHQFNIARSMGTLLLQERHLALPTIKDVLSVIFPQESTLRDKLAVPKLWLFWQRRNLIAHRRGVVDASYLSKTLDTIAEGARLRISSSQVESSFVLIRDIAIELLKCAARLNPCS
jgi:hypothetical protein